jgi:hypothetical protein
VTNTQIVGFIVAEFFIGLLIVGVGIYLRGYLKEKAKGLATKEDIGRITREVESVKSEFRVREEMIRRGSKVHELQVQALMELNTSLQDVAKEVTQATGAAKWAGSNFEKSLGRMRTLWIEAETIFRRQRLLMPEEVVTQVNDYFRQVAVALVTAQEARDTSLKDAALAEPLFKKAHEAATKELPAVLATLDRAARSIIYGDDHSPASAAATVVSGENAVD